jgi:gluconate 2-dehydrogenase
MCRKTIGIVGYGSIGEQVGLRAKLGFGMQVLAVTRHARQEHERPAHVDRMYTTESLAEVLPRCDYVVSILPGTPDTRHFWDAAHLARLRGDAVFMNLGRGTSVDEAALVDALQACHAHTPRAGRGEGGAGRVLRPTAHNAGREDTRRGVGCV